MVCAMLNRSQRSANWTATQSIVGAVQHLHSDKTLPPLQLWRTLRYGLLKVDGIDLARVAPDAWRQGLLIACSRLRTTRRFDALWTPGFDRVLRKPMNVPTLLEISRGGAAAVPD